jgi:hypothetical protein
MSIPVKRQRQRERKAKADTQQRVVFCEAPPEDDYVDPSLGLVYWIAGQPFATFPEAVAKSWIAGGPR